MGKCACIVTHTDLDGIASAALVVKHLRSRGILDVEITLAQPHNLPTALRRLKCDELYICDLGVNRNTFQSILNEVSRLRGDGTVIYWFDHHVWEDHWVNQLLSLGINLYLDVGTCSAGVVANALRVVDANSAGLVRATCSNDLWVFNDYLGNFLSRYVVCRPGNKWRERLILKLSEFENVLNDEIVKCAESVMDRDLRVFNSVIKKSVVFEIGNVKVAVIMKEWEESSTSYIAHYVMSRIDADVVVVYKEGSLSIRSNNLNIRELAVRLGGGGHPKAAGAPFKTPFLYKLLTTLGIKKPALRYCAKVISKVMAETNLLSSQT